MLARKEKCCNIKLWIIIKESSVSRAFNIICILVYCGLYTTTIDVVTWKIFFKWCIWSLHLHNFLCLPVFALFLQKLCRLLRNSSNFIYTYLKLKLGTEKHICMKQVFLPQWQAVQYRWITVLFLLKLISCSIKNKTLLPLWKKNSLQANIFRCS